MKLINVLVPNSSNIIFYLLIYSARQSQPNSVAVLILMNNPVLWKFPCIVQIIIANNYLEKTLQSRKTPCRTMEMLRLVRNKGEI